MVDPIFETYEVPSEGPAIQPSGQYSEDTEVLSRLTAEGTQLGAPQYSYVGAPIEVAGSFTPPKPPPPPPPSQMDLAQNDMMKALGSQQDALTAAGVSGKRLADQQAGVFNQLAADTKRNELERQKKEADRQKRLDIEKQKLDKATEDYSNMDVDPNRFFHDKSTANKIVGGIGVFLGGLSLQGGPNQALGMIENAINRDVDAQKSNIAKEGNVLTMKRGMYQDMLSRFGDERQAENATKIAMLQAAQAKAAAIGSKMQGAENLLRLTTLNNDIEMKKAQFKLEMAQRADLLHAQDSLYGSGDGASGGMSDQFRNSFRVMRVLNPEQADKLEQRYVNGIGFEGIATSTERAKKLSEESANVKNAVSTIDRIREIGQKSGREFLPTEAKAEAEQLKSMLQGMIRTEIVGPGAISEGEWKLLDRVVANPTDVSQLNAMKMMETLKRTMVNSVQNKARAEGIKVKSINSIQSGAAEKGK